MKNTSNEFQIASKTKKFIFDLNDLLENMPRRDYNIKEKTIDTALKLLTNIHLANFSEKNFDNYIIEIKINIAMLNFFLEMIYKRRYISLKQLEKNIYCLTEITKMLAVWSKNKKLGQLC